MMRMVTLFLFLILEENLSLLSITLAVDLLCGLQYVEVYSLNNQFVENFMMNRCHILSTVLSPPIDTM